MGSFFKGLLLAGGIMLLTVASFNYLVDPYWFSEKRISGFNDVRTDVLYSHAPVANVYRLSVKDPRAEFAIIGPSIILRGISVCNYPYLEKIAISSMSLEESLLILKRMLKEARVKKTIFIEVCGNRRHSRVSDNRYANVLSLRITLHSLKTIRASYQTKNRLTCAPAPADPGMAGSMEKLIEGMEVLRLLDQDELFLWKKEMAGLRSDTTLKHRVIFFTSPLPAEIMERHEYKEIYQRVSDQLSAAIADMRRFIGDHVELSFVNLKDVGIGAEYRFGNNNFYNGWYDALHYKPVIGDQVLEHLFDAVR